MSKVVTDKKYNKTIRLTSKLNLEIKKTAKKHNLTETKIIETGADLYIKYLEGDLEVNNK